MGLGLELDVDDAADAVAVKVHNDTSLPVEPVVDGGHSGSFRPLTHGTTPGDCLVVSFVMTATPTEDYAGYRKRS